MIGKILDIVKDVNIDEVEITRSKDKVIISLKTNNPEKVEEALYTTLKNYGFLLGIDVKKVVIK